eukprot:TRINITY_DN14012_c0_g1_i1.p1 TRINITY_DN14012_c0_g1~~TRINITY_DN14012_c0_g1_i1.p1  ORF type:complete len:197 (-),score=25.69 TRINITY_DN14012_c0_g1_i1:4-570(-)
MEAPAIRCTSLALLLLCCWLAAAVLAVTPPKGNDTAVVEFADAQWNCVTPTCQQTVEEGQYQPEYQCAEFVSRSLINGGYITNISPLASQHDLEYYKHNGKTYDLLWVSSKQGGPLGLEDLLIELGWVVVSDDYIDVPSVLMCTGSDGPFSHTALGVAPNLTDAHNMAHYHQPTSVYMAVDLVYRPFH